MRCELECACHGSFGRTLLPSEFSKLRLQLILEVIEGGRPSSATVLGFQVGQAIYLAVCLLDSSIEGWAAGESRHSPGFDEDKPVHRGEGGEGGLFVQLDVVCIVCAG